MDDILGRFIDILATDLSKSLSETIINSGYRNYDKIILPFKAGFTNYLEGSYDRYCKMKTLLYRDKPVTLKSHYVASDYRLGRDHIDGESVMAHFVFHKKNVVVGTAGSGKSVLLRKLFLDFVESDRKIAPVLVELRLIGSLGDDTSIFDYVHNMISGLDRGFTKDQFAFLMKKGKIALLLDGFDELEFGKRSFYEREVIDFSIKYPDLIIVLTSRPDDFFISWSDFSIYRVLPLNQKQASDLISKIDYDAIVKSKFLKDLNDSLYVKHVEFLSNPLLLTMMLLTYEQLAEIPEKIHIFYEQAFDTLFHKHDALKALYKRKSYTGLPVDDFKTIFSAFCLLTYSDRSIMFSDTDITKYITKAIELEDFQINPDDFLSDLIESVCILQKDGVSYTFAHRSFQEYFSARFIAHSQSISFLEMMDVLSENIVQDSVINTLFNINLERVEKEWVIPVLDGVLSEGRLYFESKDYGGFLNIFYSSLSVIEDEIQYLAVSGKKGWFLSILIDFYRKEYDIFLGDKMSKHFDLEESKVEKQWILDMCAQLGERSLSFDFLRGDPDWVDHQAENNIFCFVIFGFMDALLLRLKNKYYNKEKSLKDLIRGRNIL